MNKVWRFALSVGTSSILAAAVWALPPKAAADSDVTASQDVAQVQSASGKIASVQTDSFTLEMTESAPGAGQNFVQDKSQTKSVSFVIDKNKTVDGKLKVGANADVTYRQDNGSNVAVSVHVAPQS
jgi:hypothetical protein